MRVRIKKIWEDSKENPQVRGFINGRRVREGDVLEIEDTIAEENEYQFYQKFSPKIMEPIDAHGNLIEDFQYRWKKGEMKNGLRG